MGEVGTNANKGPSTPRLGLRTFLGHMKKSKMYQHAHNGMFASAAPPTSDPPPASTPPAAAPTSEALRAVAPSIAAVAEMECATRMTCLEVDAATGEAAVGLVSITASTVRQQPYVGPLCRPPLLVSSLSGSSRPPSLLASSWSGSSSPLGASSSDLRGLSFREKVEALDRRRRELKTTRDTMASPLYHLQSAGPELTSKPTLQMEARNSLMHV